ncbi:MAG: peptidylprolyl isomerase [Flavobacteriaceae bacterium]|nr:peptidylprolyl isomerase [Flavobacteriaceae bacterium]
MKFYTKILLMLILVASACKTASYPGLGDGLYADINTDKGDILLQLYYQDVPVTVANFVSLAEGTNPYVSENYKGKPFYNGLKFHRVVDGFVIQGGDPDGNGRGGPGYQFEDEFPVNDSAQLKYKHDKAGVLSMANSGPNSNGSQFFITLNPQPHLNGRHTVFGEVIKGMNVVDSIQQNDVMNTVKIIRIGKEAKDFDASKIFAGYFKRLEEEAKKKAEKLQQVRDEFTSQAANYKEKAETLQSGLKIYFINKTDSIKPLVGSKVLVNYAGYFTTGDLFDSNVKAVAEKYFKYDHMREAAGGYKPILMDYSPDARLIPGFREGLLQLGVGDKAMLFIPSYLGYGPQGMGPIPPNTDLIFELELVGVANE